MAKKKEVSPRDKMINEIQMLCFHIGDKDFTVRRLQNEIAVHHNEIIELRKQIEQWDKNNGGPTAIK
jgi:hypothetical protein